MPELCVGVVSTAEPLGLLNLDAHPFGQRWASEFGASDTPPRGSNTCAGSHRCTVPPRFLGIVLAEDSRVAAGDTLAVVEALSRAEGSATVWRAPEAGHGGNHLDSLHRLGWAVLGFTATATATATGR